MDDPEFVFHYTTLGGLMGILRNNFLEFHGSRYDSMNDPDDYIFARDIVMPMIKASFEGTDIPAEQTEDFAHYPYIVSFSEEEDDPFMWEHYGSKVCLKIDRKAIKSYSTNKEKNLLYYFNKCSYIGEKEIITKFIDNYARMYDSDNICDRADVACSFIKRKAFERENEWRMVSFNYEGITVSKNSNNGFTIQDYELPDDRIEFELKDGNIRSYKIFQLPCESLKGIIINEGDWSSYQRTRKQVELLLCKRNMSELLDNITMTNKYPL